MKQIKTIQYGTTEYSATLALRNKVMRIPLGLDIYKEDFSCEKNAIIIGMFDDDKLLGVGIMSHNGTDYKVEYLCIGTSIQSCGIGGSLLEQLECIAKQQGATKIYMDARVSAKSFYLRHGYQPIGDVFLLDYAPVEHIIMEKHFKMECQNECPQ